MTRFEETGRHSGKRQRFLAALGRTAFRASALLIPATLAVTLFSEYSPSAPPVGREIIVLGEAVTPEATPAPMPPQERPTPAAPLDPPVSLKGLRQVLGETTGRMGIAVIDTKQGVLFQSGAGEPHALASVAKIYLLVAFLGQLEEEQREPTQLESDLMATMIEASSNDSATSIWNRIGRTEGLQEFLESKGLPKIERAYDGSWGSMRASALDLGLLLANLYEGRILGPEHTQLALSHLGDVIESQAWGLGTVRQSQDPASVYFKNGWYPETDGWIVNSVGIVTNGDDRYVIVLLSDAQPSFEEGKVELGQAVSIIRRQLLSLNLTR